jgi:ParB family transcriptional regulator, chromosome partitioning protein
VGVVVEIVEIDLIDMGTRLRPVDEAAVPALATSLDKEGLLQAIGLRRSGQMGARYTLIWGAHRLAAARSLGWTWLSAKVYAAKDLPEGVSAVELEALENLSRSELSPYDRAMTVAGLLAAMREAAGLQDGQDARAIGGFARDEDAEPVNFTVSDLATRIGMSLPAVEKSLKLAKDLQPALANAARGREDWTTGAVIVVLSRLVPELQLQLVGWLVANPEGSLKAALSTLEVGASATLPAADKAVNAVTNNWRSVRPAERVAVLGQLIAFLTPGQRKELLVVLDAAWQADALAAVGGSDQ